MKNYIKILIFFFILLVSKGNSSILFSIDNGIELYKKGDFIGAKANFEEYTVNNPNDRDGFWWLGLVELKLKDEDGAKVNFKKSYDILASKKNVEKIPFNLPDEASLEDYFDMAASYFEIGDLRQAGLYADLMLKMNPKSPSAYFVKAQIAFAKDETEKATEYFNKAVVFNNKYLETNLAKSLKIKEVPKLTKDAYTTFALESYYEGNLSKAIEHLKKCYEFDTQDPDLYIWTVKLYLQEGDIESAIKYIDYSQKLIGENQSIYLLEAKAYSLLKDDVKVENSLQKAYKLNPNNTDTLLALANYYLIKKDYAKAKKYYSTVIEINDEFYEAYSGYIYSLIETGEVKKAQSIVKRLKSLNPDSTEVLYYLARICEYQGYFNEASEYIDEAKEKSENPLYYIESSEINFALKDYSGALKDLKDIDNLLNNHYNKKLVRDYKIRTYIKLKDSQKAIKLLNSCDSLDKETIIYKYNLYNLYQLQGLNTKKNFQAEILEREKPQTIKEYIDYSYYVADRKGLDYALKYLTSVMKKYPSEAQIYLQKIKLCFYKEDKSALNATLKELDTFYRPKE